MKIIQTFENFHAFENSGSNREPDVSGLYDFRNKPLLGGYILDVFPNNVGSVGIRISSEPDSKMVPFVGAGGQTGKKVSEFDELGTIIYWLHDLFWQLDDLRYKKTPEDDKLLAEMGEILNRDNQ
jgi:hypothetical protein